MSDNPWKLKGEGDCYRAAVNLAFELEDGALETIAVDSDQTVEIVHGIPTGTGGNAEGLRYGHAWVEIDETLVADNSRGGEPVVVPREMYYRIGTIDPNECYRYSLYEAREAMLKHGHYGPWNPEFTEREEDADYQCTS